MLNHTASNKHAGRIVALPAQNRIFIVVELSMLFALLIILPVSFSAQTGVAGASSEMYGYAEIKPLAGNEERAMVDKVEEIKKIPAGAFEARKFLSSTKVSLPYRLLRPKDYNAGRKKYPLLVVLHGSGAIGDDNVQQLGILAKSWAQPEYRNKYPCFVIAPQFPSRPVEYVPGGTGTNVSKPLPPLFAAIELIKSFTREFDVDENRIYIMGFSMGGSSAMNALFLEPEMFAAAISIAGIPNPQMAARITRVSIWLMHGNLDTENEFGVDKLMYEALVKVGARRVRFWEFDGVEHDVPPRLFGTSELPEWLFRQRR
jgi:predicted peptidase